MKREYTRPTVEKIAFDYRNQVVAASGSVTDSYAPQEGTSRDAYYNWLTESLNLSPSFANWLLDIFADLLS